MMQVDPLQNIPEAIPLQAPRNELRERLEIELQEIQRQLVEAPQGDLRVTSIADWLNMFLNSLIIHPDTQLVIDEYVQLLCELLREVGPMGIALPFHRELFGERPMPLIRFIVGKMRDHESLLYCQELEVEAQRALGRPRLVEVRNNEDEVPPELLEQLRLIEENNAALMAMEREVEDELAQGLLGRVQERNAQLQEGLERNERQRQQAGAEFRRQVQELGEEDLQQREVMLEAARQLRLEAENLREGAVRLQEQNVINQVRINEVDRANAQLRSNIDQTRAHVADKKADWIEGALCLGITLCLSWYFEFPFVVFTF